MPRGAFVVSAIVGGAALHRLARLLFLPLRAARSHWLTRLQIRCCDRYRTASFRKTRSIAPRTAGSSSWSRCSLIMMVIIVVTGITDALHPPSNVEPIDPVTLHLQGEFVESNLGTAIEPDGRHCTADRRAIQLCAALRQSACRHAGQISPHQRRRDPRFPTPRHQREHDGGAGLRRRGAHQLRDAR